MLTKRKAARKSTAAAAAMVSAKRPRRPAHDNTTTTTTSNNSNKKKAGSKVGGGAARHQDGGSAAMEVADEQRRGEMLHALGEHINTRLREIHTATTNTNDVEDDLAVMDQDVFEEKRRALMEEAELAAGTRQRVVSTAIAQHLGQTISKAETAATAAVADNKANSALELVRVRHNSNAVTALATLGDELVVFGDKSGKVYLAALQPHTSASSSSASSSLGGGVQGHKVMLQPAMRAAVGAIAVSDTRGHRPSTRELFEKTTVDMSCPSYTAVGAANGAIAIWETLTQTFKGLLTMHHKPITGLSFRALTATLYSCSADATLRVWSVPQMLSMDKLFGHEGPVTGIHALRKETCVTTGEDGTMRFWRVDAATQQSYEYRLAYREEALARLTGSLGSHASEAEAARAKKKARCPIGLECVAMLNESVVLVGAVDGSLVVFDIGRSRPLVVLPAAHGYGFVGDGTGLEATALRTTQQQQPREEEGEAEDRGALSNANVERRQNANPITAVATVAYADVAASASYDGVVRLWQLVLPQGGQAPTAGESDAARKDPSAQEGRAANRSRLVPLATLSVAAIVTTLSFAPAGDVLFVGCSKEPRRGRWVVWGSALNSVCVVPLTQSAAARLGSQARQIEHVPALLYGFTEDGEQDKEGQEDESKEAGKSRGAAVTSSAASDEAAHDEEDEEIEEGGRDGAPMLQVGADGQLVLNEDALQAIQGNEEDDDDGQPVLKRKKKKKAAKKDKTGAVLTTKRKKKAKRSDEASSQANKAGGKKKKVKKINKKLLAKTLGSAPP